MAAAKGSWFSNSILRNHAATIPAQQKDTMRNDPNTIISFYDRVPQEEISLPQFEEWAIARLRGLLLCEMFCSGVHEILRLGVNAAVLKGLEFYKSQNRKDADLYSCVSKLLDKHMKVRLASAVSPVASQVSIYRDTLTTANLMLGC